jgi:hypothetical protein
VDSAEPAGTGIRRADIWRYPKHVAGDPVGIPEATALVYGQDEHRKCVEKNLRASALSGDPVGQNGQ